MTLHKQKRRIKRRFLIFCILFILRFYCVFIRFDGLSKSAAATQIVAKQISCKYVVAKRCQHCQVVIVRRIRIRDDVVGLLRIVHYVVFDRLAVCAIRYVIIGV